MKAPLGWEALNTQLTSVLSQAAFDPCTIANTHDLVTICRVRRAMPSSVDKGYWDTVSLSWPNWEIEVFPDRFELYHFHDKGTDIMEFAHRPGDPVPEELADQLPRQGADISN